MIDAPEDDATWILVPVGADLSDVLDSELAFTQIADALDAWELLPRELLGALSHGYSPD